mmetsp:Transcript_133450/g.316348  ORF Transcript_133450/g.316348 Transcript_133450/m.316348 type:complete len:212 (-) Transcript_133450:224-859(-)
MQVHYTEAGELQFLHGFQVVWVLVNLLQPVELHSQLSELLQRGDVGGCEGTPFRALNVDLAKKTSFGCCCLPSVLQGLRQGPSWLWATRCRTCEAAAEEFATWAHLSRLAYRAVHLIHRHLPGSSHITRPLVVLLYADGICRRNTVHVVHAHQIASIMWLTKAAEVVARPTDLEAPQELLRSALRQRCRIPLEISLQCKPLLQIRLHSIKH